jgi:hypothetical protein
MPSRAIYRMWPMASLVRAADRLTATSDQRHQLARPERQRGLNHPTFKAINPTSHHGHGSRRRRPAPTTSPRPLFRRRAQRRRGARPAFGARRGRNRRQFVGAAWLYLPPPHSLGVALASETGNVAAADADVSQPRVVQGAERRGRLAFVQPALERPEWMQNRAIQAFGLTVCRAAHPLSPSFELAKVGR